MLQQGGRVVNLLLGVQGRREWLSLEPARRQQRQAHLQCQPHSGIKPYCSTIALGSTEPWAASESTHLWEVGLSVPPVQAPPLEEFVGRIIGLGVEVPADDGV